MREREGPAGPAADAVVVVRSADPQQGLTKTFLSGVYSGLARSGVPAPGSIVTVTRDGRRPGDERRDQQSQSEAGDHEQE